ncbi:hypothetical protein D9M71_467440 [compost metagenome]
MAFMKWLLDMPRFSAVLFIRSANASSLPAICSATATLASLPDWMMMPCSRSLRLTWVPTLMNMREPPVRQACSLTVTGSFSPTWPRRISSVAM